jgi:hypothetical protein
MCREVVKWDEDERMGENRAVALGMELGETPPLADVAGSVMNPGDRLRGHRPRWGLASRRPGVRPAVPVLAFSRSASLSAELDYAVIVPIHPEGGPRRDYEVLPGVVLPLYEGSRVCGHGTVLWRAETKLPLPDHDQRRFLAWLKDLVAATRRIVTRLPRCAEVRPRTPNPKLSGQRGTWSQLRSHSPPLSDVHRRDWTAGE